MDSREWIYKILALILVDWLLKCHYKFLQQVSHNYQIILVPRSRTKVQTISKLMKKYCIFEYCWICVFKGK